MINVFEIQKQYTFVYEIYKSISENVIILIFLTFNLYKSLKMLGLIDLKQFICNLTKK